MAAFGRRCSAHATRSRRGESLFSLKKACFEAKRPEKHQNTWFNGRIMALETLADFSRTRIAGDCLGFGNDLETLELD